METERLIFEIITPKDSEFMYDLMNSEKWIKHIGDRGIKNEGDAEKYIIDKMHPDIEVKGFVNYVMIEKNNGDLVGTCSLHNRKGVDGMDVGYALLPEFEGRGYGREGAGFIIELAKNQYQQKKLSAITTAENIGSCRLLEGLGFVHNKNIYLPSSNELLRLYVKKLTMNE